MLTVLLQPPQRIHPRNIASGIVIPPLWLGYLQAVLRQEGHDVLALDTVGQGLNQKFSHGMGQFRGLNFTQIVQAIPARARVVGVTCLFSSSWPMVRDMITHLHRQRPDLFLVMGGEHATAMPHEVMAQCPAHLLVMGEGEATARDVWARLAQAHQEGEDLNTLDWTGVAGVAWRRGDELVVEARRPRLRDLSTVPLPDWTNVPVADYMGLGKGHGAFQGPFMPLLATRGCPHRCTFCASENMWTTLWLPRDPAEVVNEMQAHHEQFGATDFHLVDLTFVIKKDWVLRFCEELDRRGLRFTWQLPGGTRTEAIDEHLARRMAASGLTHMSFAVESGDPAVLKGTRKKLNLKRQQKAAHAARRAGIRLFGFFIIGFPQETWGGLWRTWLAVIKAALLGYHEINITAFTPLPGTADFAALREVGKITLDDAFYTGLFNMATLGRQKSYSPVLGDRGLRLAVMAGMFGFFALNWSLRPWRFLAEAAASLKGRNSKAKLSRFVRSYFEIKHLPEVTLT